MRENAGIAFRHSVTPERAARIRRELSGAPPREPSGPQPGYEYLTAHQVAVVLHVTYSVACSLGLPKVKSGYRGLGHRGKRPYLYRFEHVERVRKVRRAAKISLRAAAQVVIAEIEGRL